MCGLKKHKTADGLALREMFGAYRSSSRQRGLEFDLTIDQFTALSQMDCSYCGAAPSQRYRKGRYLGDRVNIPVLYNGVDRVDNTKGYVPDNCATACFVCNRMKFKATTEDFIAHCAKVVAHSKSLCAKLKP